MEERKQFDAIIIGGSYAGLSGAMALGRSLRHVLVLDGGQPCNQKTPHSRNFITQDGETPAAIAQKAREQVLAYPTVEYRNALVVKAWGQNNSFAVETDKGEIYQGHKLLFATGVKDIMPNLKGFSDCWGISVLHCPYCHGYEVRHQELAVLANGDMAFELARLISNWSPSLTVLTNGKSTLSPEQVSLLQKHHIRIEEKEIVELSHRQGFLQELIFKDGTSLPLTAIFARPAMEQHCDLPQALGCALTEQGFLQVDDFFRTTVSGIYAAGDATTMMRAVSVAVAAGTKASAMLNRELLEERF